jgi:hypothetical protein
MTEVSNEMTFILYCGTDGSDFSSMGCDFVSLFRNTLKIRSNIFPPSSWCKFYNIKINRRAIIRKIGQISSTCWGGGSVKNDRTWFGAQTTRCHKTNDIIQKPLEVETCTCEGRPFSDTVVMLAARRGN